MENNIQNNISFKEIKVTEWSPNVFVYFIQLVQQLALMYFRMAEFTKANMKKEWPLEYI